MAISTSPTHRKRRAAGFSLIETMIAITILAVGMLGMAALLARLTNTTDKSRYVSMASMLASEKLEELNRYSPADANLQVAGVTAGSLTDDKSDGAVDYFDEVRVSATDGVLAETVLERDATGNQIYTTTRQSPSGEVKIEHSPNPPSMEGTVAFKRRWLIEKDVAANGKIVAGVLRITVRVMLEDVPQAAAVDFRMSMVRQYAE